MLFPFKIDYAFTRRLGWITMSTLLGSGSPPLGSSICLSMLAGKGIAG